jgi:hypothetical protein
VRVASILRTRCSLWRASAGPRQLSSKQKARSSFTERGLVIQLVIDIGAIRQEHVSKGAPVLVLAVRLEILGQWAGLKVLLRSGYSTFSALMSL